MSVSLDGSTQYLTYAGSPQVPVTAVSNLRMVGFSAWVKPGVDGVNGCVANIYYNVGNRMGLWTMMAESGNPARGWRRAYSADYIVDSTSSMAVDTWYHITSNQGRINTEVNDHEIFFNGLSEDINTSETNMAQPTDTYIGSRVTTNDMFTGEIAELAIWETSIASGEAVQLAAGSMPNRVKPGELWAYWKLLHDGRDYSGNGRDLTSIGNPTYTSHPQMANQEFARSYMRTIFKQ